MLFIDIKFKSQLIDVLIKIDVINQFQLTVIQLGTMNFEYIVIEIGWSPKLEYIRIPVYISLSQVTPVMSQGLIRSSI